MAQTLIQTPANGTSQVRQNTDQTKRVDGTFQRLLESPRRWSLISFLLTCVLAVLVFGTIQSACGQQYNWTTLAGSGQSGSADGSGSAAQFYYPDGLAVDGSGNVYVADCYNHTIRKITPGGVVITLAGSPGQSGSADGSGSAAQFYYPEGVAVDGSGNVYVADTYNYTIRKNTAGGEVSTLAGRAGQSGSADGSGSAALFY